MPQAKHFTAVILWPVRSYNRYSLEIAWSHYGEAMARSNI